MTRLRYANITGYLADGTTDSATEITDASFEALPIVESPDILVLLVGGTSEAAPECWHVTAHADASDTITVLRGQETDGGHAAASAHPALTAWRHGPTPEDFGSAVDDLVTLAAAAALPLFDPEQAVAAWEYIAGLIRGLSEEATDNITAVIEAIYGEEGPGLPLDSQGALNNNAQFLILASFKLAGINADAVARVAPRPLALGADWCLAADRAIGVNRWADQGRAGVDGLLGGDAPAVVSPATWTGTRLIGEWQSEVGASWPTLLDATYVGRLLPCQRDPANEWTEMALVTVDEDEDLLELGFVQYADGVHLGLNVRLDGESSERSWVSTGVLTDPHGEHAYRYVMDGTDLTVYVDGVEFESVTVASLPQRTPGTTDTAPFALYAPTAGTTLSVGRKAACTRSFVLLDDIDGDPLHGIDAADADDGDASFVSDGETWTAYFGSAMAAPADKRMLGSANVTFDDAPLVEIGADDSFTWAFYGRPYGTGGQMASGNFVGFLFAAASGWLYGSVPASLSPPGLPTWGFSIGEGPEYAVDAGSAQDDDTAYVAVLDRSTDELRLYIDATLVDTADVTGLGAVSATSVAYLPTGPGSHRWAAMWRRALDTDEIAYLTTGEGA